MPHFYPCTLLIKTLNIFEVAKSSFLSNILTSTLTLKFPFQVFFQPDDTETLLKQIILCHA